jgi:hypothetical protein
MKLDTVQSQFLPTMQFYSAFKEKFNLTDPLYRQYLHTSKGISLDIAEVTSTFAANPSWC